MTAYEQADQERKQLWDRKELVKSQLKDIVDPEELAKQKKRYGILEAMYEDCLLYTSPSPRDYAASRMPSSA